MRRGFTLVEVLISVMVLALGLLGLGAIIPVVVRQQRIATDQTQVVACLSDARALLTKGTDFEPGTLPTMALLRRARPTGMVAWDHWITDPNWSSGTSATGVVEFGWEWWGNEFDPTTGEFDWMFTGNFTPPVEHRLKLASRLWPSRASQVIQNIPAGTDPYRPIFVWDAVGRRVEYGDLYARQFGPTDPQYLSNVGKPDVIEVAVFVRRIDPGIRLPRRAPGAGVVTLFSVLTGDTSAGVQPAEIRMPLAVNGNGIPVQNAGPQATPPNYGVYSQPVMLGCHFDPAKRSRIVVDRIDGTPPTGRYDVNEVFKYAAKVGQRVVDNFGNVFTIKTSDDDSPNGLPLTSLTLIIDRPVPPGVTDVLGGPGGIYQLVFTSEVPVAVEVFTVRRPVAIP